MHRGGDVAGRVRAEARHPFEQVAAVVVRRRAGVGDDLPGELGVTGVERHALTQRHGQRDPGRGPRVDVLVPGRDPPPGRCASGRHRSRGGRRAEGHASRGGQPGGDHRPATQHRWTGWWDGHRASPFVGSQSGRCARRCHPSPRVADREAGQPAGPAPMAPLPWPPGCSIRPMTWASRAVVLRTAPPGGLGAPAPPGRRPRAGPGPSAAG